MFEFNRYVVIILNTVQLAQKQIKT